MGREILVAKLDLSSKPDQYNLRAYFQLFLGDKVLAVTFADWRGYIAVRTEISRVGGRPRVQGTTTALYAKAYQMMQDMANEKHTPVHYQFTTTKRKMIKWALDPEKGSSIFKWDETQRQKVFIGKIKIPPQTNALYAGNPFQGLT